MTPLGAVIWDRSVVIRQVAAKHDAWRTRSSQT